MFRTLVAAAVCVLALSVSGAALGATASSTVLFTVYGTEAAQSLVVDLNG